MTSRTKISKFWTQGRVKGRPSTSTRVLYRPIRSVPGPPANARRPGCRTARSSVPSTSQSPTTLVMIHGRGGCRPSRVQVTPTTQQPPTTPIMTHIKTAPAEHREPQRHPRPSHRQRPSFPIEMSKEPSSQDPRPLTTTAEQRRDSSVNLASSTRRPWILQRNSQDHHRVVSGPGAVNDSAAMPRFHPSSASIPTPPPPRPASEGQPASPGSEPRRGRRRRTCTPGGRPPCPSAHGKPAGRRGTGASRSSSSSTCASRYRASPATPAARRTKSIGDEKRG